METLTNCPVCNSENYGSVLTCKDHTVSKKTFTIVECKECNFKFTNPRPDKNEIGSYYESEDYISHSNSNEGIINKLYQGARKFTLAKKLRLLFSLSKPAKILDIGCGTGEFLNACKKSGWDATGIEPSTSARNFAKTNYDLGILEESGLTTLQPNSFKIITMWHVLEHVTDLNERIEEIKQLLTIDGVLIVAVPNCSSLDAKMYKEHWAAYDVPRHFYHFTPKDIEILFKKHSMKVTKILPMVLDAFYICLLSEKYKTGKSNFAKAFFNATRSNFNALKTGLTYSSQIYIIKKA